MDINQDVEFEADFRKWLVFSKSVNNPEMLKSLEKAINRKKSTDGILVKKKKTDSGDEYFFVENENTVGLKIRDNHYVQFLSYFQEHYGSKRAEAKSFRKEKQESPKFNGDGFSSIKVDEKLLFTYKSKEEKMPFLLKQISSINKLKHCFNYSLFALIVLQVVIIPGNIGKISLGDIGTYSSFCIMFLTWFLNFWTYSNLFPMQNSYREIFRLTGSYFSLLWLMVFLEVIAIDIFQGEFNVWFSLFLLLMGQFAGLIISLFTTMIMYFIKGGRIINVK